MVLLVVVVVEIEEVDYDYSDCHYDYNYCELYKLIVDVDCDDDYLEHVASCSKVDHEHGT